MYLISNHQYWTPTLPDAFAAIRLHHSGDLRRSVMRKSEVDLGRDEEGGVQTRCWLRIRSYFFRGLKHHQTLEI